MKNKLSKMSCKQGFTLVELLVVVLIGGLLAAVALPQYNKAVEKARIAEALPVLRAIANANQAFYLENGRYAENREMDLLDIKIPGEITTGLHPDRIQTEHWVYSPNATGANSYLALAQRTTVGVYYYIYILQANPSRFRCTFYSQASTIQKELCTSLEANGYL